MSINLQKGQRVSLKKPTGDGLDRVLVGLGWDVKQFDNGADFDLDSSVFMLGENGKCPTDGEIVYFGNLEHSSGAVKHMGDNRTGEGEGDDEQIFIDLTKMPGNVKKIVFVVTIYDAEERNQNFGQVENAYLRIMDESNGEELLRYDLTEEFSIEASVIVGEIYKSPDGAWKFNASGNGFQGGLDALCKFYGL